VESYWEDTASATELAAVAAQRRADAWRTQAEAGIESIPANDFSLYDHVLDTCCLVGAVPERFGSVDPLVSLDTYFAMARGMESRAGAVPPLEMTKWFDTNYHYLVPEIGPGTEFRLSSRKPFEEYAEAWWLDLDTRPVLLGPVSFLLLAKPAQSASAGFSTLDALPRLLRVYQEVLAELAGAGCQWVQLDEPFLVTDLGPAAKAAYEKAYSELLAGPRPHCLLATYFGSLGGNLDLATGLPVDGLHVDLVRGSGQLESVIDRLDGDAVLSAGVVDGRNVWRNDLRRTLSRLERAQERLGDRLWIGPSCSLQHVPHDLDLEPGLDPELRGWLAFAKQKLGEVAALARALNEGPDAVANELAASDRTVASRAGSSRSGAVRRRVDSAGPGAARRVSSPAERRAAQSVALGLPQLPTTSIGSFPQTAEIRRARQQRASGKLAAEEYEEFCEQEIERVIRLQESIGLDVLVHGEPERNDMVQYFAERLDGFATTRHGWVQSYGTRYVRPPILYSEVARPAPITVRWTRYAQSLTAAPVKGMLTGPVTILQWSFVRDDQPRADSCRQIALAIRDEVADLEAAGTGIIQVDEPAFREGMPLRGEHRDAYLGWATECFRLATCGVGAATQIHTHMCYSEFGDIADAIAALDADVVSVEAARSGMEVVGGALAERLRGFGPGVYDVHSAHVPGIGEIAAVIEQALRTIPADRLWVNPDCGLKTRRWDEVEPSLRNLVAAGKTIRGEL
jgi:5-methyltetrahydropteroyltriglutamate--homocysteine methyltransferase